MTIMLTRCISLIGAVLLAGMVHAGVERHLPNSCRKLSDPASGYTILAVGDSVTATGNYPELLAEKLRQQFRNPSIRAVRSARPGCSADATVRNYERDIRPHAPDLLLIMYGLNDEACFVSPDIYLENYLYLARRARREFNCDVLFLTPTPHPDPGETAPGFAWRTGVLAARLSGCGFETVPVFDRFSGFPAENEAQLLEQLRRLYPGPPDYIHPGPAGHQRIAQIVFDFLNDALPEEPLAVAGRFRWPAALELEVANTGKTVRNGRLLVRMPHPMTGEWEIPYHLTPAERLSVSRPLPELRRPEQLFEPPWAWYVRRGNLAVTVLNFSSDGRGTVRAVPCPWRENPGTAPLAFDGVPENESGRLRICRGETAREIVYVRHASAVAEAAEPDGVPDEWEGAVWSRLGYPHQARALSGPEDRRGKPEEKLIDFSFRIQEAELVMALKITGEFREDGFTLFFDPRSPAELGSAGPYYWSNLEFAPDGTLRSQPGETSDNSRRIQGRWRRTAEGATAELLIPWRWMYLGGFPASNRLGFSLVWRHHGPGGELTTLNWSESGHPWTPHGYGAITRQETPDVRTLPYRIRVE